MDGNAVENCVQNGVDSEEITKSPLEPASIEAIVGDTGDLDGDNKIAEETDVIMKDASDSDLVTARSLKGGKSNLVVLKRKLSSSASGKKDMISDAKDTDDGSLNATIPSSALTLHVSTLSSVGDTGKEVALEDGSKNSILELVDPGALSKNDTDVEMHEMIAETAEIKLLNQISGKSKDLDQLESVLIHDSEQKKASIQNGSNQPLPENQQMNHNAPQQVAPIGPGTTNLANNVGSNIVKPVLAVQTSLQNVPLKISLPVSFAGGTSPDSLSPFVRTPNVAGVSTGDSQSNSAGKVRRGPRSQLEEMYAPFIMPEEQSVEEARQRLKTAIEQTRLLRESFTERLYDKYRVVLRSVPKSSDAVLAAIESSPRAVYQQLQQRMSAVQHEKDMEKKISQQINAELAAAKNIDEAALILGGLTGVENAEQLSWCGAGLNLVILPEDEISDAELLARGIKERAPIDPETGGRHKDLSAAAAVAASAMLDRVRKGAEIRRNRVQKPHTGTLGNDFFNLQATATLLQKHSQQLPSFAPQSRKVSRVDTQSAASKTSKSKGSSSLPSFLSMSPDVEGLRPNGKPSAVAFALINDGLKNVSFQTGKAVAFQHIRHPFPQSKGARSMSYGHIMGAQMLPFALPNIAVAVERRKKLSAFLNDGAKHNDPMSSETFAVKKILDSLSVDIVKGQPESQGGSGRRRRLGLKRKATEIGVLLSSRIRKRKVVDHTASPQMAFQRTATNHDIDPLLVVSVMQELGLVQKSLGSSNDDDGIDDCITIDRILKTEISPTGCKATPENRIPVDDQPVGIVKTTILNEILDPRPSQPVPVAPLKPQANPPGIMLERTKESELTVSDVVKKPKAANVETTNAVILPVPPTPAIENSEAKDTRANDNAAYVPSLRGGGGEEEEAVAKSMPETKDTNSGGGSSHINSLPQEQSALMAQQQQAYAMMTAGMMADQVPPGLYQQANHQNGLAAAMNIGALQNQGIQQHINAHEQFRRHSIQALGSAQMQNQMQLQQAALQSGQFLHNGGNDLGDYFNPMHQIIPQAYGPTSSAEWANLASQQSMLQGLPHGAIDPPSLGLSHQQAAMLIRDRNVILAREQQQLQAQVASAQQNAAARMAISQANFRVNHSNQYGNQPSHNSLMRSQSVPPHATKSLGNDIVSRENVRKMIKPAELVIDPIDISKLRPSSAPPRSPTIEINDISLPVKVNEKKRMHEGDSTNTNKTQKSVKAVVEKELPMKPKQDICPSTGDEADISNVKNSKEKILLPSKSSETAKSTSKNSLKPASTEFAKSVPRNGGSTAQPPAVPTKPSAPKPLVDANRVSNSMGMKMVNPACPSSVSEKNAQEILKGCFHQAVENAMKEDLAKGSSDEKKKAAILTTSALCGYLLKVASAVPISKTLISNELKMRLNTIRFQALINSLAVKARPGASPSDVINATVTIWLWSRYQETFKAAFAKNGRIDVDPECIWLTKAAVEKATGEKIAKGLKTILSTSSAQISSIETANNIRMKIAKLVSVGMSTGIRINGTVNAALPNLDPLVDHLDLLRMKALRYRCQERVLVASLISKRTRMSEAFSNAYTSSMIRAGAALGYDDLGEIVQDESTKSSSQMPFDILSDATGAWEDPCRSLGGYGTELDSDELLKRAHARAMIQRSLKRLQDRHGIKGGTASAGSYSDSYDPTLHGSSTSPAHRPSPRGGIKRKTSFSGGDNLKSMSSSATTALFNPSHFSTPYIWDGDDLDNMPYGRHDGISIRRLRSPSGVGRHLSEGGEQSFTKQFLSEDGVELVRIPAVQSTRAIDWTEVAQHFEDVKPMEKPSSSSRANDHNDHNVAVPLGSTIYAPFCREIDPENLPSDDDSEGCEENMDEKYILDEHQKVLNTIKEKFDTMMRIRQEYQDKSRRTSFGR